MNRKRAPPLEGPPPPKLAREYPLNFNPTCPLTWAPCASLSSVHAGLEEADIKTDAFEEQRHGDMFAMES